MVENWYSRGQVSHAQGREGVENWLKCVETLYGWPLIKNIMPITLLIRNPFSDNKVNCGRFSLIWG